MRRIVVLLLPVWLFAPSASARLGASTTATTEPCELGAPDAGLELMTDLHPVVGVLEEESPTFKSERAVQVADAGSWLANTMTDIQTAWSEYQRDGWPEGTPEKLRKAAEFRYSDKELDTLKNELTSRDTWFQQGYALPTDVEREAYFQTEFERLYQPYVQEFRDAGHNDAMANINAGAKCERVNVPCRAVHAAYMTFIGASADAEEARERAQAERRRADRAEELALDAEAAEQQRVLVEEFWVERDYSAQSSGDTAPSLVKACMAILQAPTCAKAKEQLSNNHEVGNCMGIKAIHCGRRP